MQAQPLTARETVELLKHKVYAVQASGLSCTQAAHQVARQLDLDPVKVAVVVGVREGE